MRIAAQGFYKGLEKQLHAIQDHRFLVVQIKFQTATRYLDRVTLPRTLEAPSIPHYTRVTP